MNSLPPNNKLFLKAVAGRDPWLWLSIAVGILLRLHYLSAANFVIDADEGIVGLMAKHILEGAHPFSDFKQIIDAELARLK